MAFWGGIKTEMTNKTNKELIRNIFVIVLAVVVVFS